MFTRCEIQGFASSDESSATGNEENSEYEDAEEGDEVDENENEEEDNEEVDEEVEEDADNEDEADDEDQNLEILDLDMLQRLGAIFLYSYFNFLLFCALHSVAVFDWLRVFFCMGSASGSASSSYKERL